jgi:two-component system sensor histidine kinase KdpD
MNFSAVLLVTLVFVIGVAEFRVLGDGLPTILMVAVLLSAVMFGALYGVFVAAVATAVYQVRVGSPLPSDDLRVLLVFSSAVLATGAYTDLIRRQGRQALTLRQAAAPRAQHAVGYSFHEFLEQTKPESPASMSPRDETQRGVVSLCILLSGAVVGFLVGDTLGEPLSLVCTLASVILVGGLVGARFGLFAGVIAWLALDPAILSADTAAEAAIAISAFAAMGWGVGLLGDRARQAQRTLDTLVAAGRDLSAANDESQIRRGLMDSLAKLSPRSRVQVCDTNGPALIRTPIAGGEWSSGDPRWRTRVLTAADRDVGLVRWCFPGSRRDAQALDEIAVSLIDLAASAIVRAKLNLEKGDIELVARTEHLRTLLLDAVAHHFRSPLAGIIGSVTSILNLRDEHNEGVQRELLFIIKDQANRLNRYVDNFLSVARLESGDVDVSFAEVNVESLVYDVWEKFGEAGGARRFLAADIDIGTIRTDPGLLSQALGNVLENAIKYSPEGSTVDVQARSEDGRMILIVRDEGPGVPSEKLSRIFGRFYRSGPERAPGLGLGLYITRSLIEVLGGVVVAENRADSVVGLAITISAPYLEPTP